MKISVLKFIRALHSERLQLYSLFPLLTEFSILILQIDLVRENVKLTCG